LNCEDTTIISDRDKRLQAAENDLEYANHVFCIQHLAENAKSRFGMEAQRKFIGLTYARMKEQYNSGMDSLKETHRNAYKYILSINPALWVTLFSPADVGAIQHQTSLGLLMFYFEKTDSCPVLTY
jgi:hypothetical protein